MYSDVHVLLVDSDPRSVSTILNLLEVQGFKVHVARTLGEAWDCADDCSMLILAPALESGQVATNVVAEQWLGERRGPVLIIAEDVTYPQLAAWLNTGVSNAIRKPMSPGDADVGTFTSVVLRLGGIVLDRKKATQLYAQIELLEEQVKGLTTKITKQTHVILGLGVLVLLLVIQAAPDTATWVTTTAWPWILSLL